ncbi:MAG: DUF4854 domain-containing protein [Lachnospiraceae bacterium]|nr:DUF4854 domain-containing protein [Lachnospiraceae bacterium]
MKQKSVNVLLSAAVMVVTMTACGSKNNEAVQAEQPMTIQTVTNEELSSEAASDDASDSMTVDEWVTSDEAATYIQALNTSLDSTGAVISFEVDGDTLCMVFHYSEEVLGTDGSDLTEEQMEAEQTRLQEKYDSAKEQLEPMCDVFREAVGNAELVVRIVYKTSNGTELFRQDL